MTRQANILLDFMSSSFDNKGVDLRENSPHNSSYQRQIYALLTRSIYKAESIEFFARQLVAVADHAYLTRQMDAVKQASQMMLALPISKSLKAIALYYNAVCVEREGDFDGARRLLEQVREEAPPKYRARAILSIGATYYECGEIEATLPYYLEASKAAHDCDPFILIGSQKMIAVVRSIHGDHKQALDDLERLLPMVRAIGRYYPAFYYEYLNSLAVELGEVGRVEEGQRVCEFTLASPFAPAYPEFAQTRDELEVKRTAATSAIVAVSAKSKPQTEPARKVKVVFSLAFISTFRQKTYLQTTIAIATTAIFNQEIAIIIHQRVRLSIIVRGPPSRL